MPLDPPPEDPGNLTYSEAVALGLYGPQEPHASALDALVTYSVQGTPSPPKLGHTERGDLVSLPHR